MAFDTVIDKAQFEGAITASANAIRGKTGSTEMIPWDARTGLADAISAIETGGGGEIDVSILGNAMPQDVKTGVIFSSENGIAQVGTHVCSGGTGGNPVILEVEKYISDDGEFIMLDIYPKSGGTVTVTYGGVVRTITDDGTSEKPPAQQAIFGAYMDVDYDAANTPASGTLLIEGDYVAFGCGQFEGKFSDGCCACITDVVSFGDVEYIPANAFGITLGGGCKKLTNIHLPRNLKSIGANAFANCYNLQDLAIPYGITEIPIRIATFCYKLRNIIIPSSVTLIKNSAFMDSYVSFVTIPENVTEIMLHTFSYCAALRYVRILATTPPKIGDLFGSEGIGENFEGFLVPYGCVETYKTAEGWSDYADYILEDEPPYDPEEEE